MIAFYLLKTKQCFNSRETYTSIFAEMPDHLSCAMAHLTFAADGCSVSPKRVSFHYYILPCSAVQKAAFNTGSGSGNCLLGYASNLSLPHKCPYLPRESVYPCSNCNCPKANEYYSASSTFLNKSQSPSR